MIVFGYPPSCLEANLRVSPAGGLLDANRPLAHLPPNRTSARLGSRRCGSACNAADRDVGNAVYANGPVDADHTAGKLIKIGARIVRNGRYVMFQLAEVAVPRALFAAILRRIERPLLPPVAPPVKADIVPLG